MAYGIVVVDLERVTDDKLDEMNRLGARGIRLNFQADGKEVDTTRLISILRQVAERIHHLPGCLIQLFVPGWTWDVLHDTIRPFPVVVTADHLRGMLGTSKLGTSSDGDALSQPRFKSLVSLERQSRVVVKVSGVYLVVDDSGSNYSNLRPIIQMLAREAIEHGEIGLISSYSSLYARNKIKYTFVAIHSLFMAAVTMLYALRAWPALRQELAKPVVHTKVLTFLTLFRGISNGRIVGEKCSNIIERLGNSILTLFDDVLYYNDAVDSEVDTEFQSWFGLQTHIAATHPVLSEDPQGMSPHFPDVRVDIPWFDLFVEGTDIGSTGFWDILS